jgi:hypothetical protein
MNNELLKQYQDALVNLYACVAIVDNNDKQDNLFEVFRHIDSAFQKLVKFIVNARDFIHSGDNSANLVAAKLNEPNEWNTIEQLVKTGFSGMVEGEYFQMYSVVTPGLRTTQKINELLYFAALLKDMIEEVA